MNLKITKSECMMCGVSKQELKIQNHHAIPVRLRPKNNIEMPIRNMIARMLSAIKSLKTIEEWLKEFEKVEK